jgi:hypothetical protein
VLIYPSQIPNRQAREIIWNEVAMGFGTSVVSCQYPSSNIANSSFDAIVVGRTKINLLNIERFTL